MSLSENPPPPLGSDWKPWGERLASFLSRTKSKLAYYITGESAAEDGVMLWDRTGYPVVSKGGEYRQIVLADGYAIVQKTTFKTADAINTPEAIVFDTVGLASGLYLGVPASRLVFPESGKYLISFSVQLESNSASTKNAWFWPKINNVDIPSSTIKIALHVNGATQVMSRTVLFQVSANDYLEAYWATDDTDLYLAASVATAFSPAAPSVTLSATRVSQ